jgi:hypothetical protein
MVAELRPHWMEVGHIPQGAAAGWAHGPYWVMGHALPQYVHTNYTKKKNSMV